jgi:membrane-associated phospholipid phosphatase
MSVRIASVRGRLLPNGRVDFLRQILLFAGAYLLYRLVEDLVAGNPVAAFRHSNEIISLERSLHVFVEPQIQAWAAGSHMLLVIATYVYLNAQTTLLVGALVYLYIFHNRNYYFVRNMLLVAMVIALFCYAFFPAAPPRFFPEWGFIDTTGYITGISAHSAAANLFVNQFASVPSIHIAFASILSWSLVRHVRARPARLFWACWPLVIAFVTVITGNHFIFDLVLGLATAAVSALVAYQLGAIRPHAWALQPAHSSVAAT